MFRISFFAILLVFTEARCQQPSPKPRAQSVARPAVAKASTAKPAWWNEHPRIMLTPARLEMITNEAKRSPALDTIFYAQLREADELLKAPPLANRVTADEEQVWQRVTGNAIPVLAMAYVQTKDSVYLQAAVDWADKAMTYPVWGFKGTDLAAGHLLFGFATLYDWCYDDLDAETKRRIEQEILKRGVVVYQSLLPKGFWFKDAFLQNHLWVTGAGLFAASAAIVDKHPEVQPWIDLVRERLSKTFGLLGPDGASHEGMGYWTGGMEHLIHYMHMVKQLYGEDHFDLPWFRNTANYYLALSVPLSGWSKDVEVVDFADSYRRSWAGPSHTLRKLASTYGNGYAQYRARQIDTGLKKVHGSEWQSLIWYDNAVKPESLNTYPTLSHFKDMGIVSTRTSWSPDASLLVLKCGPPLGHSISKYHFGFGSAGHVHPDAGSFALFGNGRFLIRNPGYTMKRTEYENTLLVNGKGQMGEDRWFSYFPTPASAAREKNITIDVVAHGPQLDYMVNNAAAAYDTSLGLETFRRHTIFLKDLSTIIILDEVKLDRPGTVSFQFHPEIPFVHDELSGALLSRDLSASLWLRPLSSKAEVTNKRADTLLTTGGKPFKQPVVTLSYDSSRSVWNPVSLQWADGHRVIEPAAISYAVTGSSTWIFTLKGQGKLTLNPVKKTVSWNAFTTP